MSSCPAAVHLPGQQHPQRPAGPVHHLRLRWPQHPGQHAAIKTGTSEPYENSRAIGDTWALGYTPEPGRRRLGGQRRQLAHGTTSAARRYPGARSATSWRPPSEGIQTMDFEKPDGVVTANVCVPSGKLPSRSTAARPSKTSSSPTPSQGEGQLVAAVQDRHPQRPPGHRDDARSTCRSGSSSSCRRTSPMPSEQQAMEWASALGLSLPPTGTEPPGSPT